ncbi:hypothetical protein U8527_11820 [Kordia algicida OT-1]|uniref:Tyrosine specific protein phosphatases domain-containing protein n=1 Tax=Kordia algicida OT-1 TaxID=391587 RepID=A9E061_9FLAO|nr:hypothetical protein [Kordia algicida]EDP95803.1 hypothetical protein KAOT1_05347 [Kordia algicida OT-1]
MGYPREILIIRHAEKPADIKNENLATKGYERAAALAYYLPDAFGSIDHIFAAGVGHKSHSERPRETVTPLAERLNKKVHDSFLKYQYQEMISHIFSDDKYTDSTIVIAWQHTDIEAISNAFGAQNVPTSKWPGDCFDLVWKLTYNGDKTYSLTQIPQLLMYGDSNDIIVDPVKLSFCEELQNVDPGVFFGTQLPIPIGNFSNTAMTCIFQIPATNVPEGLQTQFIFVGATFLLSEQSIIDNQIAGVLNVADEENNASDLQIPFSDPQVDKRAALPFQLADDEHYYLNQLGKVGLVDGNENDMMTLVAAVQEVEQLLNAPSPTKQKANGVKNFFAQGNLVIHSKHGGSRSVTIAALYIYYKYYVNTETSFEMIYKNIICLRWNYATNNHPTQGICENAFKVLNTYEALFPEPIRKN